MFKTSRLYVDPTTYSHVDEAVEEFAMELDRNCVTMDQLIGGGEFANVFKGILRMDSRSTDIAIKVLKVLKILIKIQNYIHDIQKENV